uniref:Pinin/SDK/MemA protein domain-containing protein n=1 Tax=Romanomermis culicivorax TaxID=13658 RepID=A0A915J4P6_ROMCU
MTEIIISNGGLSAKLDEDLIKARESLRSIEEGIRSLNGRPEFNNNFSNNYNNNQMMSSTRYRQSTNLPIKRRLGSSNFNNVGDDYFQNSFDLPPAAKQKFVDDSFSDFKPSIASSVNVTVKEVKSRERAIAELKETEKTDNRTRNRRMFGLLLGTLEKFKKEEDGKQHFRDQERRQKEIDQKLEDAKRKDQMDLRREREKLIEKKRKQQQELRLLQRKKAVISATENQIQLLHRFQNFIQTQTKPPIFFMPAKHTIRTIELQKKSQKRLEEMIKRKKEELEQELKSIDSNLRNESGDENDENLDDVDEILVNRNLKSTINDPSKGIKGDTSRKNGENVDDDKDKLFAEAHKELLTEAAKIDDVLNLMPGGGDDDDVEDELDGKKVEKGEITMMTTNETKSEKNIAAEASQEVVEKPKSITEEEQVEG